MFTAHVFFTGQVQGVGFRSYLRNRARKNAVVGWVTNLPNGQVEAVFQSESQESIKETLQECRNYFCGKVDSVDVAWSNGEETYEEFQIIH